MMSYPDYSSLQHPHHHQQEPLRQISHQNHPLPSIDCIPKPPQMSSTTMMHQPSGTSQPHGPPPVLSSMPLSQQQHDQEIMMWASHNYVIPAPLCDSGYQSRATQSAVTSACFSGVSNITGLESGAECTPAQYYGGAYSNVGPSCPSAYGQPGGASSGVEMSPMAGSDYAVARSSYGASTVNTSYGMGQPTFQIDMPMVMAPESHSGEIDQLSSGIQELGRLLLDEDRETVKNSALMAYSAAKQPNYARLLVQNPRVIDAVVIALRSGQEQGDYELIRSTVGTLYFISNSDPATQRNALEVIGRSGAIPHLLALLSTDIDYGILAYTVTILHNLLSHHPNAKELIPPTDAVPPFVRLLERDQDKFLAIVSDSLRILARMHPETTYLMHTNNAHIHFIRILNQSTYEKLLWITTRLIQTLSCVHLYKQAILKAGGIRALAKHAAHESRRLVLMCLDVLRDISDSAMHMDDLNSLLDRLIQYLAVGDQKVLDLCLGILYNLTCYNVNNKNHIYEKNGIESLARVLTEHWNIPSIAENVLGTLRHLTHGWTGVNESRSKILCQHGLLPLIGRYFQLQQLPRVFLHNPKVIFEALSLLRNLATNGPPASLLVEFHRNRIVETVANLACQIRLWLNELEQPQLLLDYIEVLARALVTLSVMCRYEENRCILFQHTDIVNMANELASNSPVANIKESATKFLAALHHHEPNQEVEEIVQLGGNPADATVGSNHYYQPQPPQFEHQEQQQPQHQFQQHPQIHQQPQQPYYDHQQQYQEQSAPMPSPTTWPQE